MLVHGGIMGGRVLGGGKWGQGNYAEHFCSGSILHFSEILPDIKKSRTGMEINMGMTRKGRSSYLLHTPCSSQLAVAAAGACFASQKSHYPEVMQLSTQ